MPTLAKHRVIFSIAVAALIVIAGTVAIFWARGFKPNLQKGTIERTGLIVANSTPTGAQVYLDERLTSATDTSIAFLEPKTYKVRIEKEGYTIWQKDIEVKADLATEINALLFPQAPEIKPLTTTGATNPALSPDGTKIVFAAGGERGGVYLLPMVDSPFAFRQNTRRLARNSNKFDYTKATFLWDPDSKQVIAQFSLLENQPLANLLLDSEQTDQEPRDITASLAATLNSYQQQIDLRAQSLNLLAPDEVKAATKEASVKASPSPSPKTKLPTAQPASPAGGLPNYPTIPLNYHPNGLIFSPDEEKILYRNKEDQLKVYDLKLKQEFTLPEFADFITISWYPDSEHLVVAQKDLISVIEADGFNKMTIYSGKFEDGFVFAHPSGTRMVILTALTQQEGTPANLYSINLK